MIQKLRRYLRANPRLYDIARRTARALGSRTPIYDFLDDFSRARGRNVTFIQIGANDGLRNDPAREFIVRDRWNGILIEPLPDVFEQLKDNYCGLKGSNLTFVNAAVAASKSDPISFWTFNKGFLDTLSVEEGLKYLRKSSFDIELVRKLRKRFKSDDDFEQALEEIKVPCLTLNYLVEKHLGQGNVDLLVIDAEGHEHAIITSINFDVLNPEAIFFECRHLGQHKQAVFEFLVENRYQVSVIGGNAMARRAPMFPHRASHATAAPSIIAVWPERLPELAADT
jgi:FkbM family methyltransferase